VDGGTEPSQAESIRVEEHGDDRAHVIAVAGEVDIVTAPTLRAALGRALASAGPRPVVLDLSRVGYLASIGIAVLVHAHRLAQRRSRALRLVVDPACPAVTRPLGVTGVDALLDTYGDLASAVGSGGR
jgi:anti-sigma B factor antagonist